jgi:fumarate reductase iron-sulfur subunit
MENFKIILKRYDPEKEKVFTEEHTVPYSENLTVLDALNFLKDKNKSSVAYRSSCRMGICGSCGAIVNHKHVLMCSTFCNKLKQPIVIEPLQNFPVIKDLIVDTDAAMDKMRKALPYTNRAINASAQKEEVLQSKKQMKRFEQANACIKCLLCYSACPVYGNNKNFIGPAAGALAQRYNSDSRDSLKSIRIDSVTEKDGVFECSYIGECSAACPKNIDPAGAIQKLKTTGVLNILKKPFTNTKKK